MAGNFPDLTNYYPTRYSYKEPDGTILTTLEPAGSNINLSPLLGLMGMGDDEFMLRELASTGRHEAIHQAIHPILRDLGYESRGPSKRKYDRATEWAANLGQHHDPVNAWNALRRHPVFQAIEILVCLLTNISRGRQNERCFSTWLGLRQGTAKVNITTNFESAYNSK